MAGGKLSIVFAVIAMRDVEFFIQVSKELKELNIEPKFISFFQPGNHLIRNAGFTCFDVYEYIKKIDPKLYKIQNLEKTFKIDNFNKYLLHESLTFEDYSQDRLQSKFIQYLLASYEILNEIRTSSYLSNNLIVQELGGFIAPLALFFAAKRLKIEHIFLEPSLFSGRLHFVPNSLMPLNPRPEENSPLESKIKDYINKTLDQEVTVIPEKDRHHFKDMGLSKLVNKTNIQKIASKIKYKYLLKQKQEYENIFIHCKRFFSMWPRRVLLSSFYEDFTDTLANKKYIYFPLHVPLDCSLTIRNPEYLNQLNLVEYICQILPSDHYLYIKEHPAQIGAFSYSKIKQIKKMYKNIKIISPKENNFKIIKKSSAVITINSKSGIEAVLCNKKVLTLGHAIYSKSSLVTAINSLSQLEKELRSNEENQHEVDKVPYLCGLWKNSYESELYNLNPANISKFTQSLITHSSNSHIH